MVMCVTGGCNAVTLWASGVMCAAGGDRTHYDYGRCDRDVLLLYLPCHRHF